MDQHTVSPERRALRQVITVANGNGNSLALLAQDLRELQRRLAPDLELSPIEIHRVSPEVSQEFKACR
jgi:hypothetical protein